MLQYLTEEVLNALLFLKRKKKRWGVNHLATSVGKITDPNYRVLVATFEEKQE